MPPLRLETIPVGQIESFAEEAARTQPPDGVVAISRSRARAWARNPHAQAGDPASLVAFVGPRCVGHLGMYPDLLRMGAEHARVFWLSAFFVLPQFRASGVGPALLARAMALNEHLGVSGPSAEGAHLYRTLRFIEPLPALFHAFSVDRLNVPGRLLHMLGRLAGKGLGREPTLISRGVTLARSATRRCLYAGMAASGGRAVVSIRTEPLDEIPGDLLSAPEQADTRPWFDRGARVFNWMMHDPWVSNDPRDRLVNNHFPDVRERFSTEALRVAAGAGAPLIGFLVVRFARIDADEVMRVIAFRGLGPDGTLCVMRAILSLACRYQPHVIELPWELERDLTRFSGIRCLFVRREHRYFFRPRRRDVHMAEILKSFQPRYLDGDIAFIR